MSSTLADNLPAITIEPSGESYTRRQLRERAAKLVHGLRGLGVKSGDTIAWLLENTLEYAVLGMGAHKAGINYLALNTHVSPTEIASILKQLRPTTIITSSSQLEREGMQAALASVDPKMHRIVIGELMPGWMHYDSLRAFQSVSWEGIEAAVPGKSLLLSGGSTGCPKIVVRSGDDEKDGAINVLSPAAGDVQLLGQSLYHTGPLTIMMMALLADAHVVIMKRWKTLDALQAIQAHRVTHAFFVPTMMARIVKLGKDIRAQYDISSLRLVTHGAAPCAVGVKWEWLEWLAQSAPGCTTVEAYGMSEFHGFTVISDEEWREHPGSVGRPVGCRIVIRDESGTELPSGETGRIWFIRDDPSAVMEYLGNEEETRASYAVRDGNLEGTAHDLGYVDSEGYLFLAGRAKDMVIIGGANYYPVRTEDVLVSHPIVADAAVIGVPDTKTDLGEVLVAFVELTDGVQGDEALERELAELCQKRLGTYAAPRTVEFCTLPRTDAGKLNKKTLREQYAAMAQ